MEKTLVYIIRGVREPFETLLVSKLANYLELRSVCPPAAFLDPLMVQLEEISRVMISLPEYDLSDFDSAEIHETLELLASGDEATWIQLLHALDDRHSDAFARLKALSPFKNDYLMFLDVTGSVPTLRAELDDQLAAEFLKLLGAELDDQLAAEFLRLADAHQFPGNSYAVVVTPEALKNMRFVSAVDDLPATA